MHQDIEKLLTAAKEKGFVTEKQREIILNKTQQLGEDLTEVEFLLDDIPVKRDAQPSNPTSSRKMGAIKKCPMCGAVVQEYQGKCPECGYEFVDIEANNSMRRLMELLSAVNDTTSDGMFGDAVFQKKKSIIQNFPIPNTKSDIIEFIIALRPKATNVKDRLAKSYFVKYEECVSKAKLMFPDDETIKPLLSDFDKVKKKAKYSSEGKYSGTTRILKKGCLWYMIISLVLGILGIVMGLFFENNMKKDATERTSEIKNLLEKGDIIGAKSMVKDENDKMLVYYYYMDNAEYDLAESFIPLTSWDDNKDAELYYNWLKVSIEGLCASGDTEKAIKMIKQKIVYFEKFNNPDEYYYNKWNEEVVRTRLMSIVNYN